MDKIAKGSRHGTYLRQDSQFTHRLMVLSFFWLYIQ
jgi:hypothetical protein